MIIKVRSEFIQLIFSTNYAANPHSKYTEQNFNF